LKFEIIFIHLPQDIYLDPQHEESWLKIQAMEAPKEAPPEMEAPPSEAPQFIEQLQSLERIEGQPAHFQTRVTPVNDNQLRIQWLKDGLPLGDSNRFAFTNDFGLIALDLLHTVATDAGTYTVSCAIGIIKKTENGLYFWPIRINAAKLKGVIPLEFRS
jgi:hypothetical protein